MRTSTMRFLAGSGYAALRCRIFCNRAHRRAVWLWGHCRRRHRNREGVVLHLPGALCRVAGARAVSSRHLSDARISRAVTSRGARRLSLLHVLERGRNSQPFSGRLRPRFFPRPWRVRRVSDAIAAWHTACWLSFRAAHLRDRESNQTEAEYGSIEWYRGTKGKG